MLTNHRKSLNLRTIFCYCYIVRLNDINSFKKEEFIWLRSGIKQGSCGSQTVRYLVIFILQLWIAKIPLNSLMGLQFQSHIIYSIYALVHETLLHTQGISSYLRQTFLQTLSHNPTVFSRDENNLSHILGKVWFLEDDIESVINELQDRKKNKFVAALLLKEIS